MLHSLRSFTGVLYGGVQEISSRRCSMLRWGRPKAAEGGGSGARSVGKGSAGEVKGAPGQAKRS